MIMGSVNIYALGKELGQVDAAAEFRRQVNEVTPDDLPAARTMARLRHVDEVALAIDAAGTAIGQSRSRMLHSFIGLKDADVWVSCDDDVEADFQTLKWLVEATRETKGVCIAPCLIRRKEPVVNVMFETAGIVRPLSDGGHVMRCKAGGFGLVALHRELCERIYLERPDLAWVDEDGQEKRAAFLDLFVGKRWWTEDLSFFLKVVPADVRIEALVSGHTVHDGRLLELAQVPSQARITLPHGVHLTPDGKAQCPGCGYVQDVPKIEPRHCGMCGSLLA